MIPKVINYCWFGRGEKPELVNRCINSWKKKCPEYEIVEWNEDNFDINSCDYVREAYERKKWAFVSDYARIAIIYKCGGIYLDTDIEVLKTFDDFLNYDAFFGYEDGGCVNTGVGFGAEAGNWLLKAMLEDYQGIHFVSGEKEDVTPCPVRNSKVMEKNGFMLDGLTCVKDGIALFSEEWFCPINYHTGVKKITENTVSIHHYSGTWMEPEELKIINIERQFKKFVGKKVAFWVRCRLYNVLKIKKILTKVGESDD